MHRIAFLRLQVAWDETARLRALGAGRHAVRPPRTEVRSDRRELMLLALQPRARVPRKPRQRWLPLAAASILAACALLLGWDLRQPAPMTAISYQSLPGQVSTFVLGDGSHVILSSDSRIEARLSARVRDIALTRGEAIFEVVKDPQRPFSVAAEGYRAVAVGTRYSVRRDSDALRVAVTEGTVRLDSPDQNRSDQPSVLLPAGSVALVRRSGVLVRSLPLAQVRSMLDWPNGMLSFADAPLSEVVAEFNRFNTRKLVIADADAATLRIGGSFRWDNEDGFVRLLEAGFPIRAEADVRQIILHSR